jgi:hypothetical protein
VSETNLTGAALVDAHKSASRQLRIISILFPVVFIAVLLWNLKAIADQVASIDSAAVGTALADKANSLMPDVQHGLDDLAQTAQPVLTNALETEALAMAPRIEQRLRSDVDSSMANAKNDLSVAAKRTIANQDDTLRALIVKEFPELAGDTAAQDLLISASAEALTQWEHRQLDATVAEYLIAMEALHQTLQSSYSKTGTKGDPEDALMTWLNLLNEHMGGEEPILGNDAKNAKPAAAAAAKK